MDRAMDARLLDDRDGVSKAAAACTHQATYAFLYPRAPGVNPACLPEPVDVALLASLRSAEFGSPKHFALVEICRRAYKRHAMDLDRAD